MVSDNSRNCPKGEDIDILILIYRPDYFVCAFPAIHYWPSQFYAYLK